jgi:S-adenosylmethionine-dependent methyltransferase
VNRKGRLRVSGPIEEITADDDFERFRTGAAKYAAYLATPEGRLRSDLAFANLREFLPQSGESLRVLDIGCGTGAIGVRLARLGLHVTLLDVSEPMLDFAKRAAQEAGVANRIAMKHGDATELTKFPAESFDVILCHNILEYVGDPGGVLRSATRALRNSTGIISVLVRAQAGEVWKAAIRDGDLAAAEHNLTAEWGHESLYGGKVRLFAPESLEAMMLESSLTVTAQRGIRIVSDYLPPSVSREDEYDQIFELEHNLGKRPEFAVVARYAHCLARRTGTVIKDSV